MNHEHKNGWEPVGDIFAIIFTLLFAYLINQYWVAIPWLTDSFVVVLYMFNISVSITVASHALQALINWRRLRHLCQFTENLASIVVMTTAITVFPFTFTGNAAFLTHLIIGFIIFGVSVGALVELIKTLQPERV